MSGNEATAVSLRPALEGDESLLFAIYSTSRADDVAQAGWDENQRQLFLKMQFAAQQQHYRTTYPEGEHSIILLRGKPVGRVYVARSGEEIRILDIALMPEHRNAGIGTLIIKDLMGEAAKTGKPIRIYVETFSRALPLFERMGFSQVEQKGFHYLLEWRAADR
ncbi:MAG TPA: GNAT family N-acetyltransferase [Blastocatellia bacterium]|nr:GNAT family N-acetyltransferase [Blastocatellia bacterium]